MHKGSCLCKAVTFEVKGELPQPIACHCRQCRKHSGHFEASADIPRSSVTVFGEDNVKWYHSSEKARRGFCSICGSTLFWDPVDQAKHNWIGVAMGAFDTPTETRLKMHIFVEEKGDYYEIGDGVEQRGHTNTYCGFREKRF